MSSTHLGRALASLPDPELPREFAAQVAAMAEARAGVPEKDWSCYTVGGGFVLMIAACGVGWFLSRPPDSSNFPSLLEISTPVTAQPWFTVGLACLSLISALAYQRRVKT